MEGSQFSQDDYRSQKDGMRKDEVYNKMVRAGTRTYYFDVRDIRGSGRYITITESKRRMDDSGNPTYQRHKIFLFEEDFDKFAEGLREAIDQAMTIPSRENQTSSQGSWDRKREGFSDVEFDELGER